MTRRKLKTALLFSYSLLQDKPSHEAFLKLFELFQMFQKPSFKVKQQPHTQFVKNCFSLIISCYDKFKCSLFSEKIQNPLPVLYYKPLF